MTSLHNPKGNADAQGHHIGGREVVRPSGSLSLNGTVRGRRTGLLLPARLSVEDWCQVGEQIVRIGDSSTWWIADWVAYGQDNFPKRYKRAAEKTGLSYQTLRNYAWVARRFKTARRRAELSFQHHAQLAALSEAEQDAWLERALANQWSATELRRRLRKASDEAADLDEARGHVIIVGFAAAKVEHWQAAAETQHRDLVDWMVYLLDSAADHALDISDHDGPEFQSL